MTTPRDTPESAPAEYPPGFNRPLRMTTPRDTPESAPAEYPPGQTGLTPGSGKSRKRGLVWFLFLLIIAGVAGYAVWRAGHPVTTAQKGGGGGGGGGGRGAP